MARSAILALVFGLFALTTSEALALGSDLPKDVLAQQGPNCVHGFFVNWEDTFFFAGDAAAFNKFALGYGKRDDLKRKVVIHVGTKKARSPWDKEDRDIPVDWSYYVWNTAKPDPRNPVPSQVDVWLGSRLKLDELKIPASVEVVSGGEIEKFIEQRRLPSPAQNVGEPPAKPDLKAPWSEAVDGLQCWLEADRADWKVDEVPSFRLHVRNLGKRDLVIHMAQAACKLEFDGVWFDWNAPVSIPAGTWAAGRHYDDFEVRVTLQAPWSRDDKPIAVKPGKHKVRVAYVTLDREKPARVESNAVEIQVAAPKKKDPEPKPREDQGDAPPDRLIGYTEFRTDLPGGRYVNVATMRAAVVKADGTGRRVLAEELTREKNHWTQFRGWSPSGKIAVFSRAWMSDENGKWEEEHKTFRYPQDGFLCDGYLFDLASGKATNVTAVERVSHANEYLQFWPPGDEKKLSFSTLIGGGVSRPYVMDAGGQNKRELIRKTGNLVHGMSLSPDGKRGTYETPNYQLYIADADGSNPQRVETGHPFHLMPSWSPDGAWVLFVAGTHYDCHPHIVKADGTGLAKLASRNGYRGVIDYLDVYDFHDGSSDLPVFSPDSRSVFYTSKVGGNVELFRVTLDGKSEQLTDTPAGSMHYHPNPSRDGKWLLYGSKRDGVRQLYVMRLSDKKEWRITDLAKGHAAMWASWQPAANKP